MFSLIFYLSFSYLTISIAASESFYVSPQGNDGNPGTEENHGKPLQHAADTLQPGQTVYIHQGLYHESVATVHSGNETRGQLLLLIILEKNQ